jgi:hypothetical protein
MTIDTSIHRKTWDQIPWIVNGTLPEPEQHAAARHLQSCGDCREELEFQRHIARSIATGELADVDPQRSWQQLRARIETPQLATEVSHTESAAATHPRWTSWLIAAMVVQAIGLGVLGTAFWSRQNAVTAPQTAVYRTLSAAEAVLPGAPTIRVVFAPEMSLGRMQALLAAAGLQVLSGPSSAGVWSLGPAGDSNRTATQAALQRLRTSPEVHFAEGVEGVEVAKP